MQRNLKPLANHYAEHGSKQVQLSIYRDEVVVYIQCNPATADYLSAEMVEYPGFKLLDGPVYSDDGSTAVWVLAMNKRSAKLSERGWVHAILSQVYASISNGCPLLLDDGSVHYNDNRDKDANTVDSYLALLAQAGYTA